MVSAARWVIAHSRASTNWYDGGYRNWRADCFSSILQVERHDAICILPLNVVNEKIYIFLWFWFILLFILTSLTLVYRIIIIFSPRMRVYLLRLRFRWVHHSRLLALRTRSRPLITTCIVAFFSERYRLVRRDAIEIIVRRSKMGDWFLLYMLGENIDTVIFRDIMQELSNRLSINQHHHVPGMKGEIQDAWYLYGWLAFTGNESNVGGAGHVGAREAITNIVDTIIMKFMELNNIIDLIC